MFKIILDLRMLHLSVSNDLNIVFYHVCCLDIISVTHINEYRIIWLMAPSL